VASFNGRIGAIALLLADVTGVLGFTPQPAGSYAAATHVHAIANVTGLQAALDAKQPAGSYALSSDLTWTNIASKPATFAPSAHTHPISDVTGLQAALDGKQVAGSYAGTSAATSSASGLMSATDKAKLDGIASAATANATDAQLRDRSTHTGTQAVGTITGLAAVATSGAYADLSGRPALATVATSGLYSDLSGRPTLAAVATSGSAADLGAGTLLAARMPAFTGDVTSSSGAVALSIGANKVTRAMLAAATGATLLGATAAAMSPTSPPPRPRPSSRSRRPTCRALARSPPGPTRPT
jgi:hypothetical protein